LVSGSDRTHARGNASGNSSSGTALGVSLHAGEKCPPTVHQCRRLGEKSRAPCGRPDRFRTRLSAVWRGLPAPPMPAPWSVHWCREA
jgi:hypothetical protein